MTGGNKLFGFDVFDQSDAAVAETPPAQKLSHVASGGSLERSRPLPWQWSESDQRRSKSYGWIVLSVIVLLLLGGVATIRWSQYNGLSFFGTDHAEPIHRAQSRTVVDTVKALTVDPSQLEAVTPVDAQGINASIPLSKVFNPSAHALVVPMADARSYLRAVNCLTEAIYYEAATEPESGQRAVAQVVLNRVRHPAYPGTICGVVFQGSERHTGCQFSFTCDGSLARVPSASGWARARVFAVQAMNGYVSGSVGLATHYHADYVVPVWAKTLDKLTVIGRHIFYRWEAGGPASFGKVYAGNEPVIDLRALAASAALTNLGQSDGLGTPTLVLDTARPVLDNNGRALGAGSPSASNASTLSSSAPGAPAGDRWVIGMDPPTATGNAQANPR